jgi:hypothetical protein
MDLMLRAVLVTTFVLVGIARADEPVIRAISVPAELLARTSNPELSGIVWSPSLRRYLVVTDDSGLRDKGTNHEPLLLTLAESGALDKAPLPIRGVKKINDPESICAGPERSYFLVTSHSLNREDRTSSARRQLLQLEEETGGLRVVAGMDLTSVKGAKSLLGLAGLPKDGRLDIEAVGYHDGSLFIGFKSPLTERGEAVILRIANPLAALRAGRLDATAVNRYLAAPLCMEVKGERVCQGVADMIFLPDGALVLAANAPKGGRKDHGGGLWHLRAPIGKTAPVLLHQFPGLKPEGVTIAASGRSLAVVFDCDTKVPKWAEIPFPATKN